LKICSFEITRPTPSKPTSVAWPASPSTLAPHRITWAPNKSGSTSCFLVQRKKVSWAVFNQTVCALRFFYHDTLHRNWMIEHIPYPRHEQKLPVVLSPAEVAALFRVTDNLKHRAILMTIYAAGLRVSEVVNLRLADINSQRQMICVRQGKGRRDRQVMLSPRLLDVLRSYWKSYRPTAWLFPGERPESPITRESVWRICKQAAEAAHLSKSISPHTLRALLRDTSARRRCRSAPDPNSAGSSQPEDHGQVPARFQSGRALHRQSVGSTVGPD